MQNKEEMFLVIFPFFGSAQYAIFLCASWEFQFSNIQYFVVLTVFARKNEVKMNQVN